jgi:hypothetical protein
MILTVLIIRLFWFSGSGAVLDRNSEVRVAGNKIGTELVAVVCFKTLNELPYHKIVHYIL